MLKRNDTEIFPGIKILNSYPAIYFQEFKLLAISDLQLGEELYFAEQGIFVPQFQLKEIMKELKNIFKLVKPEIFLINGDVKHEFGEASSQEWREVVELAKYLKRKVKEVIVVRGNHDNYLLNIASKVDLKVFDPFYKIGKILFTHGHKKVKIPEDVEVVVIGHEQPALMLKEGYDKIKAPCFLYGKMKDGKKIICMPAFSPLASGVAVNVVEKDELLSPILKEDVDVDELVPIILDKEVGALKFPKIGKLRF